MNSAPNRRNKNHKKNENYEKRPKWKFYFRYFAIYFIFSFIRLATLRQLNTTGVCVCVRPPHREKCKMQCKWRKLMYKVSDYTTRGSRAARDLARWSTSLPISLSTFRNKTYRSENSRVKERGRVNPFMNNRGKSVSISIEFFSHWTRTMARALFRPAFPVILWTLLMDRPTRNQCHDERWCIKEHFDIFSEPLVTWYWIRLCDWIAGSNLGLWLVEGLKRYPIYSRYSSHARHPLNLACSSKFNGWMPSKSNHHHESIKISCS